VLLKSDSYLVQWRFMGYNSSQQTHTAFPPRGLLNYLELEYFPAQNHSSLIAVEND